MQNDYKQTKLYYLITSYLITHLDIFVCVLLVRPQSLSRRRMSLGMRHWWLGTRQASSFIQTKICHNKYFRTVFTVFSFPPDRVGALHNPTKYMPGSSHLSHVGSTWKTNTQASWPSVFPGRTGKLKAFAWAEWCPLCTGSSHTSSSLKLA